MAQITREANLRTLDDLYHEALCATRPRRLPKKSSERQMIKAVVKTLGVGCALRFLTCCAVGDDPPQLLNEAYKRYILRDEEGLNGNEQPIRTQRYEEPTEAQKIATIKECAVARGLTFYMEDLCAIEYRTED